MKRLSIMSRFLTFAIALAVAYGATFAAHAAEFRAAGDERDEVTFISKAPLEKITGKSQKVNAHVMVEDLSDLMKETKAKFVVDLASLDTNLKMRDTHMRDNYLEVHKFPNAVFTLEKVTSAYTISGEEENAVKTKVKGLKAGVTTNLVANGTLELHGVKREITVHDLAVVYMPEDDMTKSTGRPGDLLRVSGSFPTKLSDFDIKRPQFVLLKLSDDVTVEFDITLGSGVKPDGNAAMACGCGACGECSCGDKKACACGKCGDAKACGCGEGKDCGK